VAHEVHACLGSSFFFVEVFFQAYLLNAGVAIGDEWIPFSLVFRVVAGEVFVALEAAFVFLFRGAFSVRAGGVAAVVQAHWALFVGEPFQAFSEIDVLEGFRIVCQPVVAGGVDESFQFFSHRFYSSVSVGALSAVDAANSVLFVFGFHPSSSYNCKSSTDKNRADARPKSVTCEHSRTSAAEAGLLVNVMFTDY